MSNESSAVNCRRIPLTVSSVSLTPVDPENTGSESVNREYNTPVLVFGETVIFCLTFLDAAGNACPFSANDAFELAVDEDYIHGEDHLMAYASGSACVNVPGDWSEANLAQGRISIRVNCNTVGFQEKIGTDDSLTAYLEVKRTSSSSLTKSLLLKTEIVLRNTILTNEQAPSVVGREIYSADEVDVLLAETSSQLRTAINAKTTESRVQTLLSAHNQNTESHADIRSALSAKADAGALASVATSGDYDDLSGKPTIPSTAADVGADPAGTASSAISSHASSDSAHRTLFSAKQDLIDDTHKLAYSLIDGTPVLATVATTGAYSDLSGTPTLATVATSGDYNDLSNKPSIPAAQIQSDWTQSNSTALDYIKNKPALADVATTGDYDDLADVPVMKTAPGSSSAYDGMRILYVGPYAIKDNVVFYPFNFYLCTNSVWAKQSIYAASADITTHNNYVSAHNYRLLPTGTVIAYAGSSLPSGFLPCYGAAYSRTTYSALFSAIGTTYGSGNGSTTFNVPNLTDKFIQGSSTVGTVKTAGLPNITGEITLHGSEVANIFYNESGAFSGSGGSTTAYRTPSSLGQSSGAKSYGIANFSATNSNSIYGNSSTVQPPALTMNFAIKY